MRSYVVVRALVQNSTGRTLGVLAVGAENFESVESGFADVRGVVAQVVDDLVEGERECIPGEREEIGENAECVEAHFPLGVREAVPDGDVEELDVEVWREGAGPEHAVPERSERRRRRLGHLHGAGMSAGRRSRARPRGGRHTTGLMIGR